MLKVLILKAAYAQRKYSLQITNSTGVARKKEIRAEYGIRIVSYFNQGRKSYIMKMIIGTDRIADHKNLENHLRVSKLLFSESLFSESLWTTASYQAFFIVALIFSASNEVGSNFTVAFSEAKFTIASLTHDVLHKTFVIRSAQLAQCIPETSKIASSVLFESILFACSDRFSEESAATLTSKNEESLSTSVLCQAFSLMTFKI